MGGPVGLPPQVMLAGILKALSDPFTISEKAYAQRLELMALHEILAQVPLPQECIRLATHLYMYCTYTDAPDKHKIKSVINTWLRDIALADPGVTECLRAPVRKTRPTVVIPLEWANSGHVMFRCYAPVIAELRERFNLVAIFGGPNTNMEMLELFDKVIFLGEHAADFSKITELIHAEQPDVMFYPSVGMAGWCVTLSTLRMAPIQCCCPGHPASTFSSVMDYIFLEDGLVGDPARYAEKVITTPNGSACMQRPRNLKEIPRPERTGLKVAVPAIAAKLIPPFMRALVAIKEVLPSVEYHFFPNQTGLTHQLVESEIRAWFPDCVVYPTTDYQTYIENLAQCRLSLDSFPFGGTNSVIDALLCGVPVVTLEGDEVHERAAGWIMRRLQNGGLIVHERDEFVRVVVDLLHAKNINLPTLFHCYVEEEFFTEKPEHQGAFLRAFERATEAVCSNG